MTPTRDTARLILDAAADLFTVHGYLGTSTRAIAERAGVNEVTLFRHFGSKAGILRALGQRLAEVQAGYAVAAEPDSQSARETLLRLARMEIASALEVGGLAMRLAFDARSVPEIAEMLGDGVSGNLAGLAEFLAQRQAAGEMRADVDATVMAEAFFGLTSSYVMYRSVMGAGSPPADVDSDQGIEQLFDIFWSGTKTQ